MFDPLDLYTPSENVSLGKGSVLEFAKHPVKSDIADGKNDYDFDNREDDESPVDILDLPSSRYASSEAILCVLLLLKPDNQVNFCSQDPNETVSVSDVCHQKGVSQYMLESLVLYYKKWNNARLNSPSKICSKIPKLNSSPKDMMLKYYTCLLKHYQESLEQPSLSEEIVKQLSLRISEKCGRSAQPAMSRQFTFEKLNRPIEIYEPSLTADNLGWKTWGSSYVLSQKLVENMEKTKAADKLRVLELGSGTGLAGISWLSRWIELNGANNIEMFLTDLPEIIFNLQRNVEANELNGCATVSVLDWTDSTHFETHHTSEKFDIIIISDPIYSPGHPKLVVDMLGKFLSISGTCYLEIPLRDKYAEERKILWKLLEENGLDLTNQTLDKGMEDWGVVNYLYQEIRKR